MTDHAARARKVIDNILDRERQEDEAWLADEFRAVEAEALERAAEDSLTDAGVSDVYGWLRRRAAAILALKP